MANDRSMNSLRYLSHYYHVYHQIDATDVTLGMNGLLETQTGTGGAAMLAWCLFFLGVAVGSADLTSNLI